MPLTVTFDLEDNRHSPAQEERFTRMTQRFLDFAEERGIRATVFVVGELARSHPALVRRVVEGGHELGLHGLRHVTLGDVGASRLGEELREGRALLESTGEVSVRGFRAPIFSLTPATSWAVDHIAEAGFSYSSSVLPASSPLHGWPGAPQRPWRWDNGLMEFPCPVAGAGRAQLPFLGGIYMRYLPMRLARRALAGADASAVLWSYVHPYDLDTEEPFFVLPHANWLTSRIVHTRRGATLPRLEKLIAAAGGSARSLGEISVELELSDLPLIRAV